MAIQVSIDRDRDEFAGREDEKPQLQGPRRPPKNLVPGSGDNIIAPTPFGELNDEQLLQPPPRKREPRKFAETTRGAIVGGRGILGNRPRTSETSPGTVQSRQGLINIASPDAQRNAAANSVTARNRGELRDTDFDQAALASAGIAGLEAGAVTQDERRLSSVSVNIQGVGGVSVPNFGDPRTAAAANRFNSVGHNIGSADQQRRVNADPTRAQFQTQFQRGETLKDTGGARRKARSRFRVT
jgi:hypothetical protein